MASFWSLSKTLVQFHMWLPLPQPSPRFEVALKKTDEFWRFVTAPRQCGLRNTGRINRSAHVCENRSGPWAPPVTCVCRGNTEETAIIRERCTCSCRCQACKLLENSLSNSQRCGGITWCVYVCSCARVAALTNHGCVSLCVLLSK